MTNQTTRVLELLKRFNNGQKVCIEALQNDDLWEGKSEKTIRRDLDVIKEVFPDSFELVGGEKGCYKAITKRAFDNFISQDMLALMVKTYSIAQYNDMFDNLNIDKDDKRIIEKKIKELKNIYEFKSKPFENHTAQPELYKKLEKAIYHKKRVTVTYEERPNTLIPYEIKPYKILFMNENFYLACEVAKKQHKFTPLRISKIKGIEVQNETFYHDREVEKFIQDMQTLLARFSEDYREKLIQVRLEVSREKAQHFETKKHLASQKIEEVKENGNLILSFEVTQNMEVEELVKKWIPHLKVLAPESLKKKIEKDMRKYLD